MEASQQGLLEDLLAPMRENWTTFPSGEISGFFPSGGWNCESFDEINDTTNLATTYYSNTSFVELITSSSTFSVVQPTFHCPYINDQSIIPLIQNFSAPAAADLPYHDKNPSMAAEEVTTTTSDDISAVFSMGLMSGERKSKSKKVEGQPSKNLMAERRRRKRLNDRLSMLRSIVPKISKMDRTSILGDTIDYMKELLEKIDDLKEKDIDQIKELNMNEVQLRNPPKFDVERKKNGTIIEICCTSKPGLVLNTVNTLDALGLDIQQCVVSCFNDFSLQASCSELAAADHQTMISSEDIKELLFRNAGYGGRCL